MSGSLERVLKALEDAEVRYLVVGGVAVVLHGHLRTTADIDVVVQLRQDNVERALAALSGVGYRPRARVPIDDFADPSRRTAWRDEKNMTVFSLWNPDDPGFAVDLFLEEPFEFDEAFGRAVHPDLGSTRVSVVGLADLIAMKAAVGRPLDVADIEGLRALDRDDHEPSA